MVRPTLVPEPAGPPRQTTGSRRGRLGILWVLYLVQGLPYGFQATALPVYLREEGTSLAAIGFASLLSLPWMLKIFWGPLVDRYSGGALGPRRTWIVPLQIGLALAAAVAAVVVPGGELRPLLALVVVMNLCAATMDVAVDGLAVDLLEPDELGYGNIAQVVGFKLGMLTGGGLLLWASGWIGWAGLFGAMSLLVSAGAAVTLAWREPARRKALTVVPLRHVMRQLQSLVSRRSTWALLLVVATYKMGESMADAMFRPFLVDAGFAREQIGLWLGTWGLLASIAGSIAGGVLASRSGLWPALFTTSVFRVGPLVALWWVATAGPSATGVIGVTVAENFFGGALTTAMFAFMMSRVDREIGATHFTLLATVEVWGKIAASSASGLLTEATSYTTVFGLAALLSLLFVALVLLVRRPGPPPA